MVKPDEVDYEVYRYVQDMKFQRGVLSLLLIGSLIVNAVLIIGMLSIIN